ncbi:MAG TPA: poly-beta-1,6-N-acetyl-D-glucosamine biosynthesis protein PgaD [Desulfuromonadales bacterium]|nr:poly-beta-1,6-N-acetyl-D-glucosamine biosynthesis protein PgaD [Desulfuromonadales bacterium]
MSDQIDAPVISRPDRQSTGQRYGQRLLTLLFWLFTVYLLRPLITLIAWASGLHLFSEVMLEEQGLVSLLHLLGSYAMTIAAIGAALGGWAIYNLLRFRGRNKRIHHPKPVPLEEEAAHYGLDNETVREWRNAPRIVMHYDREGNLLL